uniref:Ubiquitin-like protease family profile domain-containing protein n=1 Tax=Trichogramma kaykai TaxID=54128 RepID=A0ABD2WBE4_9HYME
MRDQLPKNGPRSRECAIVNLDSANNMGSHWVAYHKNDTSVVYFDSFGDLEPPPELMRYWNIDRVYYNYKQYQKFNTYNCGHLCLKFLKGDIKVDHPRVIN